MENKEETYQNLKIGENGDLVHINQNLVFENEPFIIYSTSFFKDKDINDHKDKYGKPLINQGSKFHK